ncbi:hypothetical protein D3C71_1523810 [compost metagenome]
MATGTQINPAPTAGSSDRKAIKTPQSTGPWMPSAQKIMPPNAPWDAATTMFPLTVALITVVNFSISCLLWASFSGVACPMRKARLAPSRNRKNNRYSIMPKLTTNSSVFCPTVKTRVARNWLACTETDDSFSCSSATLVRCSRSSRSTAHAGMAAITC